MCLRINSGHCLLAWPVNKWSFRYLRRGPELASSLLPKLPTGRLLETLCSTVLEAGTLGASTSRTAGHPQGCCRWEALTPFVSKLMLMLLEPKLLSWK